jgi:hypothetical protein
LKRSGRRWRPRSTSSATRRITRSTMLRVNRYSLIVKRNCSHSTNSRITFND